MVEASYFIFFDVFNEKYYQSTQTINNQFYISCTKQKSSKNDKIFESGEMHDVFFFFHHGLWGGVLSLAGFFQGFEIAVGRL